MIGHFVTFVSCILIIPGIPLHKFTQDYNTTRHLALMLEIKERACGIMDWRNLAAAWGYDQTSIDYMRAATRHSQEMGLVALLEKETTERHGMRTLEDLMDGLEKIRRNDAVCFLSDYLVKKGVESTF